MHCCMHLCTHACIVAWVLHYMGSQSSCCKALHLSIAVVQQVQLQASQCCHTAASDVAHLLAGCGETSMLLACGLEPRGCLRLAHRAVALSPVIAQGPHMPVCFKSLLSLPSFIAMFLMLRHRYHQASCVLPCVSILITPCTTCHDQQRGPNT